MDTVLEQRILVLIQAEDVKGAEAIEAAARHLTLHAELLPIRAHVYGPSDYYTTRIAAAQDLAQRLRDFLKG